MDANAMKSDSEEFSDVSLRLFNLSDIDDMMVWASDNRVAKFGTSDPYTDKERGIHYIQNTIFPHPWFRAICVNNRSVGAILVTRFSGNDKCRGEIGYYLAYEFWGKGIATQAVKLVADTIFTDWPDLERLEGLVDVDNVASQKVLTKAGFQREGILRKDYILKGRTVDLVMFSLLSTDNRI